MFNQASIRLSYGLAEPSAVAAQQLPTLKDLFKDQPTESFKSGKALFWQGENAGPIFEIKEGVVRTYRAMPDGRRAILNFAHPGDVLGMPFQDRNQITAEAVNAVKVRRFARERFFQMIDGSAALRSQFFTLLCDEISAAQDQMLLLGRQTAEERVVSFLLAIHCKMGCRAEIALPMSRQDTADYLGLTMETVSRIITNLSRRGYISLLPHHTVAIRELASLKKIAGQEQDASEAKFSRSKAWPL